MANTAARMRAHRARLAQGRAVLHVEAEIEALADLLTEGGFLSGEFDFENHTKVARGLERFVEAIIYARKHGIKWWRDA